MEAVAQRVGARATGAEAPAGHRRRHFAAFELRTLQMKLTLAQGVQYLLRHSNRGSGCPRLAVQKG